MRKTIEAFNKAQILLGPKVSAEEIEYDTVTLNNTQRIFKESG